MIHPLDAREPRQAGEGQSAAERAEPAHRWRPPRQLELFEQDQLELDLVDPAR